MHSNITFHLAVSIVCWRYVRYIEVSACSSFQKHFILFSISAFSVHVSQPYRKTEVTKSLSRVILSSMPLWCSYLAKSEDLATAILSWSHAQMLHLLLCTQNLSTASRSSPPILLPPPYIPFSWPCFSRRWPPFQAVLHSLKSSKLVRVMTSSGCPAMRSISSPNRSSTYVDCALTPVKSFCHDILKVDVKNGGWHQAAMSNSNCGAKPIAKIIMIISQPHGTLWWLTFAFTIPLLWTFTWS